MDPTAQENVLRAIEQSRLDDLPSLLSALGPNPCATWWRMDPVVRARTLALARDKELMRIPAQDLAVRCGDIRVLDLLLSSGLFRSQFLASLEGEGDPDLGLSPLHSAVALKNLPALDSLLRAGHDSASYSRRRLGGMENALHCAVRRRATDATALILWHDGRHGSGRPFTRDARLHIAALRDDAPEVTRLLDLGMHADAKAKARTHPLRFVHGKRKIFTLVNLRAEWVHRRAPGLLFRLRRSAAGADPAPGQRDHAFGSRRR